MTNRKEIWLGQKVKKEINRKKQDQNRKQKEK